MAPSAVEVIHKARDIIGALVKAGGHAPFAQLVDDSEVHHHSPLALAM